jgi:hypothetical protein
MQHEIARRSAHFDVVNEVSHEWIIVFLLHSIEQLVLIICAFAVRQISRVFCYIRSSLIEYIKKTKRGKQTIRSSDVYLHRKLTDVMFMERKKRYYFQIMVQAAIGL